ncbi:MAG: MerC domain-containing protein [Saprospiraceae bacterium]|nr:MerC domain-containing protein [Saprospiraceae bacterium]
MEDRFLGIHLDFLGFIASFLCAIHCAILPLVFSISIFGGLTWIGDPVIELSFLLASFGIATLTLVNGYRKQTIDKLALALFTLGFALLIVSRILPHAHGIELVFAVLGGLIVASAHVYHWIALRRKSLKPLSTG